jgi:hypothetical protein
LRRQPIGARRKETPSRREGKALRNRVQRGANTPWIPPDRKTRPPLSGKQSDLTGKEFRFNSERIPPYERLDLAEHDKGDPLISNRSTRFQAIVSFRHHPVLRSHFKLLD